MPLNKFNLPISSFEIVPKDDPNNIFLPKGTLLVAENGDSYRAKDHYASDPLLPEFQTYGISYAEGGFSGIDRLTRQEAEDIGLVVVWYPEEEKEEV